MNPRSLFYVEKWPGSIFDGGRYSSLHRQILCHYQWLGQTSWMDWSQRVFKWCSPRFSAPIPLFYIGCLWFATNRRYKKNGLGQRISDFKWCCYPNVSNILIAYPLEMYKVSQPNLLYPIFNLLAYIPMKKNHLNQHLSLLLHCY